jgi:hypothetical protein
MPDLATVHKFNTPGEQLKPGQIPPAMPAVNLSALAGIWINVDPATRDIVKVILTPQGQGLVVHAYGACTPTPCDWGDASGVAYDASVSGGPAVAFTANYNFGFKTTILTGHLEDNRLIVEDFNVFHDGSGRSSYFDQGTFRKG